MSSPTAARVLSGYRRLFRSQRKLFANDQYAQNQAKIAIRSHFEENKSVQDSVKIEEMIKMIDEADDMLSHGILQGRLNEQTGNYDVKVKAEHTSPAEVGPDPSGQADTSRRKDSEDVLVTSTKA